MLHVENISKELGGRTILDGVSFVVNAGEPAGLVGPNGCGKTTLLRIVAGDLEPDRGVVRTAPGVRIGHLPQGYPDATGSTVGDLFPALFTDPEAEVERLARQLAEEPDPPRASALADEFDRLLRRLGDVTRGDDIARGWRELGLREIGPETPAPALSGGELAKLGLLDLFASGPEVLLLDEPTNHLDLAGMAWLEERIAAFSGPVLVVSHDRVLLDNCVHEVIELDPESHRAESFPGGYTEYADEKARREAELWERYERQHREERRLKRAISAIESRSRNIENRTIHFYFRKRAAKVARRAVTLKARLEREAASADYIERPTKASQGLEGRFQAQSRGSSTLIWASGLTLEAGGRRLLENASFELRRGERVALAGPNGSGKTTLLRAIVGEGAAVAGDLRVAGSARAGYLPQEDIDELRDGEAGLTPVELLRRDRPMPEADAYNFLHRFLFGHDQLSTPVVQLSYGERRRLALARLILGGANLLLLDEPTNHLDLPSREAFEAAFESFDGAALVVTHDRYFIERFADRVLTIRNGRLVDVTPVDA